MINSILNIFRGNKTSHIESPNSAVDDEINSVWSSNNILISVTPSVKHILGWEQHELLTGQKVSNFKFIDDSVLVYTRKNRNGEIVKFEKISSGFTANGEYYLVERLFKKYNIRESMQPLPEEFEDFLNNGSIPLHMVGPDGIIR